MTKEKPASRAFVITPSDGDVFYPTRGVYVGGAGDLRVDFAHQGTGVVLTGIAAGTVLPIEVTRVYATGTTATNLVGLS